MIAVTQHLLSFTPEVSTALHSLISFDIVRHMPGRTALLINCSQQELEKMRACAEVQHRTLSGYVLNIVMRTVVVEENLFVSLKGLAEATPVTWQPVRPAGPRTTMLLRCSIAEATRIRAASKRRKTTISAFVLHTLQRSWSVIKRLADSPGHPSQLFPRPSQGTIQRRRNERTH